jgi:hypothetical protein
MGLTTWRGGTVQKADVTVAKNYLNEQEIAELNRIVVMFLDFAEDQARRKQQVFLRDWQQKLDESCGSTSATCYRTPGESRTSRRTRRRRLNTRHSPLAGGRP